MWFVMWLFPTADHAMTGRLPLYLAGVLPEGTTAEMLMANSANKERLAVIGLAILLMMVAGFVADLVFLSNFIISPQSWINRMRKTMRPRIRFMDGLIFLAALIGMAIAGSVVYLAIKMLHGADSTLAGILIQSMCMHWTVLLTALILIKARRQTLGSFMGIHLNRVPKDIVLGLICYLGALPVILIVTVLYRIVLWHFGVELDMQDILLELTANDYPLPVKIYLLLFAVILVPLAEELLFRGYCFRYIGQRWGGVAGLLITSLFFAVIHQHIPSLAPIFALACCLSVAYWMTGSLLVPITMHAVFNANSLLVMLLME